MPIQRPHRAARVPVENAAEVATRLREASQRFRIRGQARNSVAASDIAESVAVYGGYASNLQRSYAESLIERSLRAVESPTVGTPMPVQEALDMTAAAARIARLFQTAAAHSIQRPAIHLQGLRFTRAPSTSRNAGSIYVTSNSRLRSERVYYGRIQDGVFVSSPNITPAVLDQLRAFGEDPSGIARAHGQATGVCCFCRHPLTDGRSVAMGYGPICAEHYGLEWGEQRARSVVELLEIESTPGIDYGSPAGDRAALIDFGSPAISVVNDEDLPESVRETARQVDAALAATTAPDAALREAERLLREARQRVERRRAEFNARVNADRRRRLAQQAAARTAVATVTRPQAAASVPALPEEDEDSHFM